MKKKVATLLVFMLAALVFYGGAGVNIISYCCNHCRVAGIEAVIESSCCEIHNHSHVVSAAEESFCASEHMDGCGIERLHFDWTSVQLLLPDLQPAVIDLWFAKALNISLLPMPQVKDVLTIASVGPPVSCPRTYLLILTTLLI